MTRESAGTDGSVWTKAYVSANDSPVEMSGDMALARNLSACLKPEVGDVDRYIYV